MPQAQVDLLVSTHSEDLFAIVPSVRQVVSVPFYPKPKTKARRYGRRLKAAWRVRQIGYDAIINLQAINSTSKAIAWSRAPYKLALRGHFVTDWQALALQRCRRPPLAQPVGPSFHPG
jgi:ADP-heptose:LPS heptosyltransferase